MTLDNELESNADLKIQTADQSEKAEVKVKKKITQIKNLKSNNHKRCMTRLLLVQVFPVSLRHIK